MGRQCSRAHGGHGEDPPRRDVCEEWPPLEGLARSMFANALHQDCKVSNKGLWPGALCVVFAQGGAEPHLVPELGLSVTLAPGEACVGDARAHPWQRAHGGDNDLRHGCVCHSLMPGGMSVGQNGRLDFHITARGTPRWLQCRRHPRPGVRGAHRGTLSDSLSRGGCASSSRAHQASPRLAPPHAPRQP